MAFLVYRRSVHNGVEGLNATGNAFSLAGYNLIYASWQRRNKPIHQGWHISINELIELYSGGKDSYDTLRFLIDFDPSNKNRVALIELLEIYLYTWGGDTPTSAGWTPMMLRLRDVLDEWSAEPMSPEERTKRLATLWQPAYRGDFVEFLYLKGDDGRWNWGRNGSTNAVFLHDAARDYFRSHF